MNTLPKKYRNQNYTHSKFFKYSNNKQLLRNFKAALDFVEELENIDNGIYISPGTNLNCYYKDSYLFYFNHFDKD